VASENVFYRAQKSVTTLDDILTRTKQEERTRAIGAFGLPLTETFVPY